MGVCRLLKANVGRTVDLERLRQYVPLDGGRPE